MFYVGGGNLTTNAALLTVDISFFFFFGGGVINAGFYRSRVEAFTLLDGATARPPTSTAWGARRGLLR